jgi:hypothetical protein
MRQFLCSLCASLLCLIALAGTSVAADGEQVSGYSQPEIIEFYVGATLRGVERRADGRLHKWPSKPPVTVVTYPQDSTFATPERHLEIVALVDHVAEAISSPIGVGFVNALDAAERVDYIANRKKRPQRGVPGTIAVYVGTRAELRGLTDILGTQLSIATTLHDGFLARMGDGALCFSIALNASAEDDTLVRSYLFLEDGPELERCVLRELMRAFGLVDLPAGTASIFSDDRSYEEPTELDWLLWRIHFDARLKAGMTEAEVRAILPVVLDDLMGAETTKT